MIHRAKKLVFISWVPDTAKVKWKTLYAATTETVRSKFVGINEKIEASDLSELTEEIVANAARR